jgi:hypothetical protein
MRSLLLSVLALFPVCSAVAGEIREFDLKTIERLGNEVTRASQRPDRGATNPVRQRAKQTAIAALKGKLFDIRYDYVVLNDPDGSGFLVYALAATEKPDEVVLGGHFRVSVSGDGDKVEQVDSLSRTLNAVRKKGPDATTAEGLWTIQLVSEKPVETFIYLSNLNRLPIFVGTPDRTIWKVEHGKIQMIRDKQHAK